VFYHEEHSLKCALTAKKANKVSLTRRSLKTKHTISSLLHKGTNGPPYPWLPHPQIQANMDQNIFFKNAFGARHGGQCYNPSTQEAKTGGC
jgi:hypothetical protein